MGEDKRLLADLAPRLTEVATLSKAVGQAALASSTNALNAVCHAAVALDRFGRILEINPAMQTIVDDDIFIGDNRLRIRDPKARDFVESLVDRLTAVGDIDPLADIKQIVIRRRSKRPVIMRVLGVPAAARNPFLGARAILTFDVVEPKPGPDISLLRSLFLLTLAEARLAAHLTTGRSLDQAAEKLGISSGTARAQLKSVFDKTNTHRQGELVALLARL